MELIHNQVIKLLDDGAKDVYPPGIYRVIFEEPITGIVVTVCLQRLTEDPRAPRGGRPKLKCTKRPRKKSLPNLIGELIWMERETLNRLDDRSCLIPVTIERESIYLQELAKESKAFRVYELRLLAMRCFLDFENLKESIIVNRGLGGLVKEAMNAANVSRYFVYKQWSLLCRLGFSSMSFRPRFDRCGAPGVSRPCDPNGREKAGRKTKGERIERLFGKNVEPQQPGMSTYWRLRIMAADRSIKGIKPKFDKRYTEIINSAFVAEYKDDHGTLTLVKPELGSYPNHAQVRRVLKESIPHLERILEKTTKGHFNRSLRGLRARNWKGVAGPGHTWAIDSTIADIYLRSSIDRSWIIGRPIVYIVVDVWSTAIVGFYVCLSGPSWNTARIALFNSCADPALLGELWGYQPILSLNPLPTLAHRLLGDRGEYLSKGASLTAVKIELNLSYAPPYRPDLKGIVEVLHRIEKDAQFGFIPGAIDMRRQEYELRRIRPEDSVLTLSEYVQFLHIVFAEYNLTADRRRRVDAHMAAAGVFPSPSGLWRWGHAVGVGFQREIPASELFTSLLEADTARVGRSSIQFGGNDYYNPDVDQLHWTTIARNFHSWEIPVSYYPGSVSRIWSPNPNGSGLMELLLSDQSRTSAKTTFDEMVDAFTYAGLRQNEIEHQRLMQKIQMLRDKKDLVAQATLLTQAAIAAASGPKPTIQEARQFELADSGIAGNFPESVVTTPVDDAMDAHQAMMRAILHAKNQELDDHE